MGPKLCEICKGVQSKYKCPSCFSPYCSLSCFKKHKEQPCTKQVQTKEISTADAKPESSAPHPITVGETNETRRKLPLEAIAAEPVMTAQKPLSVDEPSAVVQKLQLESIASSSKIRDALKDESLQKLIVGVDTSANPENELDKAMGSDVFRIFTEKLPRPVDWQELRLQNLWAERRDLTTPASKNLLFSL